MAGATDEGLRRLARRLAGRVAVRLERAGRGPRARRRVACAGSRSRPAATSTSTPASRRCWARRGRWRAAGGGGPAGHRLGPQLGRAVPARRPQRLGGRGSAWRAPRWQRRPWRCGRRTTTACSPSPTRCSCSRPRTSGGRSTTWSAPCSALRGHGTTDLRLALGRRGAPAGPRRSTRPPGRRAAVRRPRHRRPDPLPAARGARTSWSSSRPPATPCRRASWPRRSVPPSRSWPGPSDVPRALGVLSGP